ncbi:MAG: regulatory protein RecX [Saprospiraceae bacterium]|nr:regulatory protein RecX [Saprospiraceae bacterium]MDZ4705103.1 regulatory protein RecX [Saprospiraceae bacterium]
MPSPEDRLNKRTGKAEALLKLQRFCAYQDRCHSEVRSKLLELGVYGDDLEEVMVALIEEDFLNEERFARSYARGKFRIKQWGRVRIRQELKRRQISEYCIKAAFSEIDETEYWDTLRKLLSKQQSMLRGGDNRTRRDKLFRHALQKGYESELILEVLETT